MGVTSLLVLAFLPGKFEDKDGNADPRRLILDRKQTPGKSDTVDVVLHRGFIECVTPLKPLKD